jgi:hypothetical protein
MKAENTEAADPVGFAFLAEILWLKLPESAAVVKGGGAFRVFVGYRGNTRFPRPIQHQQRT